MDIPAATIWAIHKAGVTKKLLTAAIVASGYPAAHQGIRAAVRAIREKQAARDAAHPGLDELIRAAHTRPHRLARMKEARSRAREQARLLASPIAQTWRKDRRHAVAAAASREYAADLAIFATLEAITRLACSQWGFTRRHTSDSGIGVATSRYLVSPHGEVRLSDHYLPDTPQRDEYAPRWHGELVIDTDCIFDWSLTRWRRELVLRAAGRR